MLYPLATVCVLIYDTRLFFLFVSYRVNSSAAAWAWSSAPGNNHRSRARSAMQTSRSISGASAGDGTPSPPLMVCYMTTQRTLTKMIGRRSNKLVFKYFGVATSVQEMQMLQEDMNCSSVLLFTPTRLLSVGQKHMEVLNATFAPKS